MPQEENIITTESTFSTVLVQQSKFRDTSQAGVSLPLSGFLSLSFSCFDSLCPRMINQVFVPSRLSRVRLSILEKYMGGLQIVLFNYNTAGLIVILYYCKLFRGSHCIAAF